MLKFFTIWSVVLLNFYLTTASHAQQSAWNHNNSIVEVSIDDTSVKIYYLQPRTGLPAKAGSLLFDGNVSGSKIVGIAYLFSEKCGPIPYDVSGFLSVQQNAFTMYGKAPRRGPDCRVASYFDDALTFNFIQGVNVFTLLDPNGLQRSQSNSVSGKNNSVREPEDKELERLRRKIIKYGE